MGLLQRLRRENTTEEADSETAGNIAYAAVQTRNQSATDAEDRQNKGIDIDMIDPQEVIMELEGLAHYEQPQGRLVGEPPNVQYVPLPPIRLTRTWAIAALGYLNKVWPTICMSTYEADTTKLRIRTAFHDIRKSMSYEEKKKYGIILRLTQDLCLSRCEDMKDGTKALLLKVRREELGVHLKKGNGVVGKSN